MHLILCHTTADFDTLGAAVGLTCLHPGARVVLTGGAHPTVRQFLAFHRDRFPLIERRAVNRAAIRAITVVDTQWRDRLGKAADWLTLPNLDISIYDHHLEGVSDIPAQHTWIEPVGASTTLVVEQLQQQGVTITPAEATVMALGIHVDTGSLTFDQSTVRDAAALTWLMQHGASVPTISQYVNPGLSPLLQDLLSWALANLQTETQQGHTLAWVMLDVPDYVPGLSSLASHLTSLTQSDVLLLAARYGGVKPDHAGALAASGESGESGESAESGASAELAASGTDTEEKLTIIGRSRASARERGVNLSPLFHGLGGGGHPSAAAVTLRTNAPETVLAELVQAVRASVRPAATARQIMSAPVRTIRPETAIAEAQRILLRYGHSGLSVVDEHDQLVGIISRRDLDLALHHGFSHAPVKGYMTTSLKTITPDTALADMEALMVTHDIGRLPVLQDGHLVGIVTRTDVLRQVLQRQRETAGEDGNDAREENWGSACPMPAVMWRMLGDRLAAPLWNLLAKTAELAASRGWQLFMVGGAVRDLLLTEANALLIPDVDLVVDGCHSSADQAAGVALARAIEQEYPQVRLQIHGRFQTAALTWHNDPTLDSLWLDIATARTEFYPYPAANPEVEASSIRQDLYRRDFTINALAIRLSEPRQGELLDFFGGLIDLQKRQIRVLHVNSFIEDPTRIYRAVRFAVRLGFELESQTEAYIRYAIASGIYSRTQIAQERTPALQTRLKRELKYILEAPYWKIALRKLADLDALKCLHPQLMLDDTLWWQLRLTDRWLARFDATITLDHWQVLLEVILAYLPVLDRGKVATGLQLPVESSDRLTHLAEIEATVSAQLQCGDRPSQIVQVLNRYSLPTLALVGIRCDRPQRQIIWRYLTHWSQVKPPLSGNDLRRLGYLPGKQFKQILEALLMATLDGELRNRAEAEMFVTEQFPRA